MYYLFTWTSGTFNFEAGVRPEREDFLVRINPEFLLLEGARRVDEWSLIEKKIPSFDLIFSVDPAHIGESSPELSAEQHRLVPLLDGTRDVQAVIDGAGWCEFEVGKALYGLITAGFAHRTGTSTAAAPKVNDSRVDEHRNLGIAFYKAAMLDEALREFRRVADLRPTDTSAPFYLGLIAVRQGRWDEAAAAFKQAAGAAGAKPAALHNLGLRPRAAGPAGRGRGRVRRRRRPRPRGRPDHAGLERGGAQARRAPGGPGAPGARPRADGREARAGTLVLGRDARERGPRRRRPAPCRPPGRASAPIRRTRCSRTTSPSCSS